MNVKYTLFLLLLICNLTAFAQKIDKEIDTKAYKAYISAAYEEPVYVVYKLYHGGGDCDRDKFTFKNDTKYKLATDKDYAGSGYDKGHLANAEDFAYNCKLDELTFRYYNCVPQAPHMNRGAWKKLETAVRKESQTDSLEIICGSIYNKGYKKIGDGVAVPNYCYKIVYSLSTRKYTHIMLFANTDDSEGEKISLDDLQKKCPYPLPVD